MVMVAPERSRFSVRLRDRSKAMTRGAAQKPRASHGWPPTSGVVIRRILRPLQHAALRACRGAKGNGQCRICGQKQCATRNHGSFILFYGAWTWLRRQSLGLTRSPGFLSRRAPPGMSVPVVAALGPDTSCNAGTLAANSSLSLPGSILAAMHYATRKTCNRCSGRQTVENLGGKLKFSA